MTIICFSCGKACTGEVLKVQERHFHINCFKCHECGTLLASGGYFPRNDHYYCSKDYHKQYGTKCKTCGDFVEGRVITALGHSYHPQCFKCDRCKGEIRSGTVVTYNDKEEILCQNCSPDVSTGDGPSSISPSPSPSNGDKASSKTPPPSQREQTTKSTSSTHPPSTHPPSTYSSYSPKTRTLIGASNIDRRTGTTTTVSTGVSSPLTTSTSSSNIPRPATTPTATPLSTSTPSNVPSSVDDVFDFSKVPDIGPEIRPFMGKCAQCQESIRSAQSLIALNRHWHLFCFSCARCKRYLTNEYMDNGDQAYCEPCFQELYGLICETCQEYITGTVLEAGDRHFHPACAFCSKCSLKFGEGDDLCVAGDEVYHLDCERAKTSPANKPPPMTANTQEHVTRVRPQSDNPLMNAETRDTKVSPRPNSRPNRFTPDTLGPPVIFPLKELQLVGKVCLPKGVNRTKLEQHLSDSDFFSVFRMDRNTFFSKPQWKQIDLKKRANLF